VPDAMVPNQCLPLEAMPLLQLVLSHVLALPLSFVHISFPAAGSFLGLKIKAAAESQPLRAADVITTSHTLCVCVRVCMCGLRGILNKNMYP
jgi:hypothetical protein